MGGVCQWGRGGDFIPFDVYVVLTVARASQISSPANCGPNVVRGSKIFKKTRHFKFHVKFLSISMLARAARAKTLRISTASETPGAASLETHGAHARPSPGSDRPVSSEGCRGLGDIPLGLETGHGGRFTPQTPAEAAAAPPLHLHPTVSAPG